MEAGQVVELPAGEKPFIVNPLTVAPKKLADGSVKLRLVVDLKRYVN